MKHMFFLSILLGLAGASGGPDPARPFEITVVDEQTGRGVPLVELETVNHLRYVTDSQGIVAFDEPGLMDREVFFHVKSHGYEFPKDGFGFRGKAVQVTPGGKGRLAVKRINVAERLYRITGAGVYRDSVLTGQSVPIKQPLLNARVFGSDSVENVVYGGRIAWFWGDTNRPNYPLGNFHVPGATSLLPSQGGLDPDKGIDLDYFVDAQGFAKETARLPGSGPTWIGGLVVLKDDAGRERMLASYVKIRNMLDVYEHGLVEFADDRQEFEKVATFPLDSPVKPSGHPFPHQERGTRYIYYATPYPLLRVRAERGALKDLANYESFTCLRPGTRLDEMAVERDADGKPVYGWKTQTPVVGPAEQMKLVQQGKLGRDEGLLLLRDVQTGKPVQAHGGSVYWNDHRRRWVMIAVESGGTSFLGEVWYAEADTPLGPWLFGRKIVSHEKYSFYNPKQHPMFDKEGGRVVFFEGTYTQTFSGNPEATPRYDYNQVLYKLDLSDPRLNLPVAVYRSTGPSGATRLRTRGPEREGPVGTDVAFFALERPEAGTRPVFEERAGNTEREKNRPLFHVLPIEGPDAPSATTPLYEYESEQDRFYTTDAGWSRPGYRRLEHPIGRVWRNPFAPRVLRAALAGQGGPSR